MILGWKGSPARGAGLFLWPWVLIRGFERYRLFSTLSSKEWIRLCLVTPMKPQDKPIQALENRKTERTMWFRGQYVPILYSRNRVGIFGTEQWVARGTIQRVGATIFAMVFFSSSIGLFLASVIVRGQIAAETGGFLGQVFGTAFAVLAFCVGCFALLLTFRLARGVARSFHK